MEPEVTVGPDRYKPGVEFDSYVANYYVNKLKNCKERGLK